MFLIYSDEKVNTFLPWFPLQTVEETRDYLHNQIYPEYEKESAYHYAVVHKQINQVIGYVSLCGINVEKGCGELGYGLRQKFWNQGITTEACKAVLERLEKNDFRFITATP